MGTWSVSPQYRDLRTPVLEHPSAGSSFLTCGPANFFSSFLSVPALFFLLPLFLAVYLSCCLSFDIFFCLEFTSHLPFLLEHGCANHDTEGKRLKYPIHCCDVTNPPYLLSGELCTSPLHCKLLFVYTVCCRRTGQCFSVLRTRKSDVILTQWTAVVGEVTSPSSDTTCHSCAPVF